MKKDLKKTIEIPEGVEVSVEGTRVTIKGKEGELKKQYRIGKSIIEKKENEIILHCKGASKTEKKLMNSVTAHIRNMIKGVQEKFEYELKICSSHFPMNVEIKGADVWIKNFLGEKNPRSSKIIPGCEVENKGDKIIVRACDIEKAGQTSANFEKATTIPKKDKRIFQDGIYITKKPRGEI